MVDLNIDFAGVKFRNPILTAAMTFGWSGKSLKYCASHGPGGVVCKSIGSPKKWLRHPQCGRMAILRVENVPVGMQDNELYSTIDVESWIRKELKEGYSNGTRMVVSIVAHPNPDDTAKLARKIADTGLVDIFELNVSCPMPSDSVGMWIGKDPDLTAEQVKAVKETCPEIPLMPKMTPNVSDITAVAKACEKAGADAISAINSLLGLIGVDIESGEPFIPAFGGYEGPAIKPISLRYVAQIAQAVKIPVSGIGGVSNWKDAIEMMMVGAKTVQIGTAVLWYGPRVIGEIIDGIKNFMKRKGYSNPEDFIGVSLKHIISTEELVTHPPMVPHIDHGLCTRCGNCVEICAYNAIKTSVDGNVRIIPEKCDGCGLCVQICPSSAMRLVEKDRFEYNR